jgi:hypothetical protein
MFEPGEGFWKGDIVGASNRRSAVLLVALALLLVIKTKRLLGYEGGTDSRILAQISAELAKEERFQDLTVEVEESPGEAAWNCAGLGRQKTSPS